MDNSNVCARISNEDSDRISDLPDDILHHILSLIETKEAMQKSLLSKRWLNICSSLPCLNLHPPKFTPCNICGFNFMEIKEHSVEFKKYVETVLYHRQASFLHTFRVQFPQMLDKAICFDLIQICFRYSMKHNCRVFSMVASIPSEELCECLFACKSLEEMCLRTSFWNSHAPKVIPQAVNLPHIRRLHLTCSTIDRRSISRLRSGCPVLEELTLESCHLEGVCIFNHKLKYLHLLDCGLKLPQCKENLYIKSRIQGDTVESAIRTGCSRVYFIWKTPGASAVDVNPFSFMQKFFQHFDLDDRLRHLSVVTTLKIDMSDYQMLDKELKKLKEFQNLKELSLGGWCMTCNFSPVALFLQKSPNLQRLTLYNFEDPCQQKKMRIHRMVDFSMIHKESWRNHIKAHKLEEALLPSRQVFENVKVVLFQFDKSFYCVR